MKKHLLYGFVLVASMSAFSQNATKVRPNGITDRLVTKGLTAYQNETANSGKSTAGIPRPSKLNSAAKTSSTIATGCMKFSGSTNAFGGYQDGHEALQYNAELNALSFIHRCSPAYNSIPNGNSGVQVAKYSTNLGSSWDSTVYYTSTTNLGRYPQGGLYNPPGNTTFTNAYVVGMGEYVGSAFDGTWYASKQITVPGNTTPGVDMQAFSNVAPFGGFKKVDFPTHGFTNTKDGFVRGLGQICNDINATTNLGRGNRGAAILKGTFNAGAFVWSYDSLVPPTMLRTDGSKYLTVYNNMMAWNESGTVGYAVLIGVRAGTSGATKGYQPIVYKTTNSGASWSLLPAQDFSGPLFQGVWDRCASVSSNTALVVPFFSTAEGMDAAVDINDNLHIATTVVGHYSNHNDSLDYTNQYGTELYAFPYGASFSYPTIYDFYTTSSGGWNYHIVDSMETEGPGTGTQPGGASNPWGPSGVFLDARIQMAVSADRKKMFYSWTESNPVIVTSNWNIYPDIKTKGFDVTLNKVTPRVNVTGGVLTPDNADQQSYMFFMANKTILTNSVTMVNEIPFTITYNGANDGNQPVTHFYIGGASLEQSDFVLNPLVPTGIASNANSNVLNTVGNYPNPASDFTTISLVLNEAKDFEVTLYNAIGQLLKTINVNGQIGKNNVNLDLSNLSSGVYVYTVKTEGSSVTKKLIVE
jgi:hypothetical protein